MLLLFIFDLLFVVFISAVWCSSRPCVQWRSGSNRPEILHKQCSTEFQAQRRLIWSHRQTQFSFLIQIFKLQEFKHTLNELWRTGCLYAYMLVSVNECVLKFDWFILVLFCICVMHFYLSGTVRINVQDLIYYIYS